MPETTSTMITGRVQKPMALCQLKSRALPLSPPRNHAVDLRMGLVQRRGHQRTRPVSARTRKATLQAPVMALPTARPSPSSASQRWRPVNVPKMPTQAEVPASQLSPV